MICPRCRGAMPLVKIANKPDDIARVLADPTQPGPTSSAEPHA
ncbi:hypothetical protein DB30_05102 [Enhygromyxa salina]|uniref:Uncharacterized protein n=1 Tax=Enhygromyxa salina TaxID=215803 RepID=A0A0C2CY44_9BACT|nr:hypothetical protein DB30_05102 [Enhygromyxa salina]